ncbi:MAG: aminomethyl transferase family protein [Herpetosiphonaceae bacterium]|nr:aminomethyl transferase family protein [Herpetosiphonaceae bacterium]
MNIKAYDAAATGAVYLDRSTTGCVEVTGRDRLVLVNRLSTNALLNLAPGQGQITVLTTNIGRIIDLVTVLAIDDNRIWVITSANRGEEIAKYLDGNKFFNDEFTVRELTEMVSQMRLYGPQSTPLLAAATGLQLDDLAVWQHVTAEIDGCPVRLVRIRPIRTGGWAVFSDVAAADAVIEAVDKAGAVLLDRATFNLLRVESGYPNVAELNREYIPLEANLWDAVSFSKGCYVGQEIIARMESRGKLAKKLMGLQLSGEVQVPAELLADGKNAGDLTSLVYSPALEHYIGLGYVRTAHEPGAVLQVGDQTATVVEVPFIQT